MNLPMAVVRFVGVRLTSESRIAGARLMDIPEILGKTKLLVAAVVRGEDLIIPRGKDRLHTGDLVYFISERGNQDAALEAFGKKAKPVKRVMIVGGGQIGIRLASQLEKKNVHTKIIEKNADVCSTLAEQMNKAVVLHGDGSDQSLLLEENIKDVDLVVTLTGDEETNILVSLLTKNLGVPNAITKISKFSYFPLMSSIGIQQVVSPRLSAINSILQHIRRGKVISALSVQGERAEVIEAVALPTSDIAGKSLKNISFPKGAILIGIVRGEKVIIPDGDSVVYPDDTVIIFAQRNVIQKLEKMLTVKLEFY